MKLMKHLFSSLFIAGAMLSTQALAEEKTSEQAQPQMQETNCCTSTITNCTTNGE